MARSRQRDSRHAPGKRSTLGRHKDPFGLGEPISPKTAVRYRWAAMVLVAILAGLLLWVALGPHKVGDYYTETDFYGGYAEGARLIQTGHFDPSRYTVVGPVFELAVALLGFVTRDLFRAAEFVAILAACGTIILWFGMLARRAGPSLAFWTVLFLAVNPTFFRYGYSVTTDSLGTLMQAGALFVLFVGRRGLAPLWAGLLAALATLTRYNAIYLFPGAVLYYACFDRGSAGSRLRAAGLFLVGFAVVGLPWLGLSIQSGQMPGGALFHNIAYDIYAKSKGISWDQYEVQIQPEIRSLRDVVLRAPAVVLRRELTNSVQHVLLDLKLLLGWPIAVWCMLGLILALWDITWRRLLPIWILGGLLFVTLVPAIHSERYSLPLAPFYLTLAGAAAASPSLVRVLKGRLSSFRWVPVLLLLCISGVASVSAQRDTLRRLPVEILEAAKVVDRTASRGARIMARKPHIAYYSGLTFAPFPVLTTLAELSAYCAREKVDFIYFSEPEADTRPEFTYLLDPEAQIPGLRVEGFFRHGPGVLYRVESGFGTLPGWFGNDSLRTLHVTRALNSINAATWRVSLVCGNYAVASGQFEDALAHFNRLTRLRPDFAEGYSLTGQAYANLGRLKEAGTAFARALELQPDNTEARWGLGVTQFLSGRPRDAANTWRSMIEAVEDSTTLVNLIDLYEKLDDRQSALRARETLLRRYGQTARAPQ